MSRTWIESFINVAVQEKIHLVIEYRRCTESLPQLESGVSYVIQVWVLPDKGFQWCSEKIWKEEKERTNWIKKKKRNLIFTTLNLRF